MRRRFRANIRSCQVSSFRSDFGSPIRLPIALSERAAKCARIASLSLSARMMLGKWRKPLASRADQSKHPDEPLRLKEI